MKWLHGFSILVAVCALVVLSLGAQLTNQVNNLVTAEVTNPVTNEVNNQISNSQLPSHRANITQAAAQHRTAADALALLAVIQIIWMLTAAPLRSLAGISFVLVATEILLGRTSLAAEPAASQMAATFYHSVLAQLFLALSVVIATITAPSWQTPPITIPDKGWPSLRGFASLTAILVFLQVILGAAFRHDLLGVMWHIIGALLLALFLLGLVMLIVNQPPESVPQGNPLRTPAIILIVIAALQLTLGMTVISISSAKHAAALAVIAILHTANGALTFAVTVMLMLLARRHVRNP